jgi:ferric-dicitrate binding protein FerR (iron transport regulator)
LLALGAGSYWYVHQKQAGQQIAQNNKIDRTPGGNKAILTLSNGKQIVLNGKQGHIASQAGKQVSVNATGAITYTGQANSTEIIYNTLTVPIGNTREITLSDGTQVSLDAGSSITYPVIFGKDRKVAMTGQAYFNVKHDPAHPFYTTVKGLTIADIGTEFNINAYDDEPSVKTTLVTGSVKVNETELKPGEQANAKGNNITVKAADLQSVTAWKNNEFYFRSQSLKSSMRQIARWYNVSVNYNNVDEKLRIFVDVSRAINLSVVLKAIENTGKVKCSFDGHTITLSQPN